MPILFSKIVTYNLKYTNIQFHPIILCAIKLVTYFGLNDAGSGHTGSYILMIMQIVFRSIEV